MIRPFARLFNRNSLQSPEPTSLSSKKSVSLVTMFIRTLKAASSSSYKTSQSQTNSKKPLVVFFQEAVGLREKAESESETEHKDELRNGLKELEREVRELRLSNSEKKEGKKKVKDLGLYSLFADKNRVAEEKKQARREEKKQASREEKVGVSKGLSPDMEMFVSHLYREGYFSKANFLPRDGRQLDFTCFDDSYGKDFIKFAAEKFGKDHQAIAKWLSGSDLKKVALFGCPSTTRKIVFSAKQLRTFFEIQEDTVCQKCPLKESCKFVNQSVWKSQHKSLYLAVVMRIITLYALESVPPQLTVPNEIKASVSRLLKEVIKLSQTKQEATSTT